MKLRMVRASAAMYPGSETTWLYARTAQLLHGVVVGAGGHGGARGEPLWYQSVSHYTPRHATAHPHHRNLLISAYSRYVSSTCRLRHQQAFPNEAGPPWRSSRRQVVRGAAFRQQRVRREQGAYHWRCLFDSEWVCASDVMPVFGLTPSPRRLTQQKCRLEDKVIKFEIWDTAGQERFHSLAPMYYRNAQASAVIYDVTKASSFEKAKSWVKELQRQANPNIVIALVGNKIDLLSSEAPASNDNDEDEDDDAATTTPEGEDSASTQQAASQSPSSSLRAVPKEEAQAYADESGLLFFETSAKTGQGVVEVFTEIAKKINPQDIQQRAGAGAASSQGTAGRTGRDAAGGSIDIAEGNQGRRAQDACNC